MTVLWSPYHHAISHTPPGVRVPQLEKHAFPHFARSLQKQVWLARKASHSMGQGGVSRIWKGFMLFLFPVAAPRRAVLLRQSPNGADIWQDRRPARTGWLCQRRRGNVAMASIDSGGVPGLAGLGLRSEPWKRCLRQSSTPRCQSLDSVPLVSLLGVSDLLCAPSSQV